jgi:hypothetical protein
MEIEYRDTGRLAPYSHNNRKHSEKQIADIVRSIQEFGFDQPILINADGLIIAGHGRWMAAQQLGLDKVPCVVTTLEEVQERARRILDNKLQNDSEWDFDAIGLEVGWLEDEGYPVEKWGLNRIGLSSAEKNDAAEDDSIQKQQLHIVIDCDDEDQQKALHAEFTERGLKCKIIA